jgi:DNA-binding transcriptional MerR regulator
VSDEVEIQIPDKMFFRIGELAELVGVEPHVLRYWEQEFRVRPQRSPSGQRMYRRKDISKFLKIKQLLYKQGFTIAGARRALSDSDTPADGPMDSDLDSLRSVADRLAALRDRIGAVKERIEHDWDRHLGKG